MTVTSIANRAAAGGMADSSVRNFSYTTTVNTYEVIATLAVSHFPAICNYIAVTDNDLLFKFEYTRDGTNWITSITDFPIAAGSYHNLSAVRQATQYRVSVKPAGAGAHGSCTWQFTMSDIIVPPEYRAAFAYESVTVSSAHAESLTLATYDGAFAALITVEDNPIRVRWDGTAPTTSEGHLLQSGDTLKLDFTADIYHFQAIATGADAKIRVTYAR